MVEHSSGFSSKLGAYKPGVHRHVPGGCSSAFSFKLPKSVAARWILRLQERPACSESQATLFEADELVAADDDMVKHFDIQQLPGLAQLLGGAHVFG